MKEIKDQKYNKFHEKHKAPVKMATITIPADIAKFVMELSNADVDILDLACNRDISGSLWELIANPTESKATLESLLFHHLQLTTKHEPGSVNEDEITLFSNLSDLFNACIKYRKKQKGGRE